MAKVFTADVLDITSGTIGTYGLSVLSLAVGNWMLNGKFDMLSLVLLIAVIGLINVRDLDPI